MTVPLSSPHPTHSDRVEREREMYVCMMLANSYHINGSIWTGEIRLVRSNPVELAEHVQKTGTTRYHATAVINRVFPHQRFYVVGHSLSHVI